jgi:DNA-binding MarR family transcriptional regulator
LEQLIWYDGGMPKTAPATETRRDRLTRDAHVSVIVAGNRFTDGMEQICREEGLSQSQYVALWVLCLTDDPGAGLPMGAIADGLLNRASDTTRLVDRLVKMGLVERMPNPADRRGVLVRATPAGRKVFEGLAPRVREFYRNQWAALTNDEIETLIRILGTVRADELTD